MASCCTCTGSGAHSADQRSLPLICLVPRGDTNHNVRPQNIAEPSSHNKNQLELLDEEYIKKHFKLPQRPLYLDPFRRPLITFPMTQEDVKHFNLARKYKINQQILDGFLDPAEAISAPSVFPYAKTESEKRKKAEEDEEIIYILQLPDWEFKCPIHNQTVRTPRFIWHSCKKSKKTKGSELKQGGGPLNKPKPWLLSRHTDFDLLSQWPIAKPGMDALGMSAPILIQMNQEGKWENHKPKDINENDLKAVVHQLVGSKALSAVQSYCCQCAAENQNEDGKSNYVPVIMMPIYSADQCPFDLKCEIQGNIEHKTKTLKKTGATKEQEKPSDKDESKKKLKKRTFILQRLTDFDLLSQW